MRPRIRTIKPEALLDEALWDLEQEMQLPLFRAFTGLWCHADREGRFEWRPRALKAGILPYWEGDFERVLDALAERNFIEKYAVAGREYGLVRTFKNHQVINQREAQSTLPAPGDETHVRAHANTCVSRAQNVPAELREKILGRDGRKCLRCGSTRNLTIDHIFPQCLGGNHAEPNLRTLCKSCNSKRPVQGDDLLADLALDGLTMDDLPRMCMHVQELPPCARTRGGSLPFPSSSSSDPGGGAGGTIGGESLRGRAANLLRDPLAHTFDDPLNWPEVRQVFAVFVQVWSKRRAIEVRTGMKDPRLRVVVERFADGCTVEQVVAAIRGSTKSENLKSNPEWQTLQTILRDVGQVEKFIDLLSAAPALKRSDGPKGPNEDFERRRAAREGDEFDKVLEQARRIDRERVAT